MNSDAALDRFLEDPTNTHWVRCLFGLKPDIVRQLYHEKFGKDAPEPDLWFLMGRVEGSAKRHRVEQAPGRGERISY